MTRQATDLDHLAENIARERIAQEKAAQKATYEKAAKKPPATPAEAPPPVPVPQPAWEALERMQLAAQVSQQQLQVFVDGLALGQGVAQGAQLTQMPQGGWAWVVKELPAAA